MCWKSRIFLKQLSRFLIMAIAALPVSIHPSSLFAEEKPVDNDDWKFQVVPYMWFLSLDGDVTVKGRESDLDLSFSDIWDELNIAGMLTFDVRKSKWGFFGDMIAANLGKSKNGNRVEIEPTIKLAMLTAGRSYQLGTWKLLNEADKIVPAVTVDGMFGVRYTRLDIDLDFERREDASSDKDWVDPLIGARAFFDLSEHWNFTLMGNVGGFGVGSEFTWGAMSTIGYRFSLFGEDNNARAVAGYRAIYQDYTDGSGRDKFKWDVTFHGPMIGLAIEF
jgi:hypothetical protein